MRKMILSSVVGALCSLGVLVAQGDPQPTCKMCPATYIPKSEIDAYVSKAIAERLTDQQVRDVEIGKAHIGVGVVHRGKLDIDPDKATPLRDEAASKAYLSKPRQP